MRKALKDLNEWWDRLLWVITEGDPTGRRELLRMDIFEFYSYMEVHEHIIEKRLRQMEERQRKIKGR